MEKKFRTIMLVTLLLVGLPLLIGMPLFSAWMKQKTTTETGTSSGSIFDNFDPSAMIVPAIVLTVMIMIFWGISRTLRASGAFGQGKAFRDAPIGIGTITSVRRTGLTVNDQPQLQIDLMVQTADGNTFNSSTRQIVDLIQLSSVVPGVMLPVRYLPGNPPRVEIDQTGDNPQVQAVFDEVRKRAGLVTDRELDIASRGVCAQAVVTATQPTGQLVSGHPRMMLGLIVTRPDGTTYETRVEKTIPPQVIGYVQVGRVVDVRYLPGYENDLVLSLPANTR